VDHPEVNAADALCIGSEALLVAGNGNLGADADVEPPRLLAQCDRAQGVWRVGDLARQAYAKGWASRRDSEAQLLAEQ
jgi:hypothetical protein